MSGFHHFGEKPAKWRRAPASEGRLPLGVSILAIAALSALSWAFLIAIVMALRAAI